MTNTNLLQPLVEVIETVKRRIAEHGASLRENEIRTRLALIDPVLHALGWDVSDPAVVTPEFTTPNGRADYALKNPNGDAVAAIFLEAKKLGENLQPHRMQMLNYANASGVDYAGLTDGQRWELYDVFKRGELSERQLLAVSITDAPAHESALKLLLLWRPNLASPPPTSAQTPIVQPVTPNHPTSTSAVSPPQTNPIRSAADRPNVQTISEAASAYRRNVGMRAEPPLSRSGMPPDRLETPEWLPLESYKSQVWAELKSPSRRGKLQTDGRQIRQPTRKPRAIRFGDGAERSLKHNYSILVEVALWLFLTKRLEFDRLPVTRRTGRVILGLDPEQMDLPQPVPSSELFVESKLQHPDICSVTIDVLKAFGVDPANVWVRRS